MRSRIPPLHVRLDIKKVLEANAPWFAGSCFKHEPAKLRMKDWRRIGVAPVLVSIPHSRRA